MALQQQKKTEDAAAQSTLTQHCAPTRAEPPCTLQARRPICQPSMMSPPPRQKASWPKLPLTSIIEICAQAFKQIRKKIPEQFKTNLALTSRAKTAEKHVREPCCPQAYDNGLNMGPKCGPKWGQKWGQNGAKMGPKWVLDDQNGAKMGSKWGQNGAKMGPKWVQNGSKMGPKWVQNGSTMGPKWV